MSTPKLSFIVLSYNYQDYIRTTLRSILDQTVQDFEVVVVDDCSTDDSRAVIQSFGDPRIRLLVNESNLGGAGSYNVAVQAARGEWLVNLDADDWIAPDKCALQLAALAREPEIDIIGSWIHVVDASGARHPQADETEALCNRAYRLNSVEAWVGQNPLCRSSTMVRRAAHLRVGLDDASMVRAPDYELWTRFLAAGCRFHLLPERLTFYRLQARGVTHADPVGTLLEFGYAAVRNLLPLAEKRALYEATVETIAWFVKHPHIISLPPDQSLRLLSKLVSLPQQKDFLSFRASLAEDEGSLIPMRVGRHALFTGRTSLPAGTVERLMSDIDLYIEAREFWRKQAENWEAKYHADIAEIDSARDAWRMQAEHWEAAYRVGLRHRVLESIKSRLSRRSQALRRAFARKT